MCPSGPRYGAYAVDEVGLGAPLAASKTRCGRSSVAKHRTRPDGAIVSPSAGGGDCQRRLRGGAAERAIAREASPNERRCSGEMAMWTHERDRFSTVTRGDERPLLGRDARTTTTTLRCDRAHPSNHPTRDRREHDAPPHDDRRSRCCRSVICVSSPQPAPTVHFCRRCHTDLLRGASIHGPASASGNAWPDTSTGSVADALNGQPFRW